MGGDPWDPETRANFIGDVVRKVHGLVSGDNRQLRSGAERPIGLGAVHPHPPADAGRVDLCADRLDHPGPVTVWDHPRGRHGRAEPAPALLGVARIDAGESNPHADVPWTWLRVGQFPQLKDVGCRPLPVIPSRLHSFPCPLDPTDSAGARRRRRSGLTKA